jgi:signal transduction histidine kinase
LKDELATLPAGSQVTFSARTPSGANQKPGVVIQVSDNGPGLPQEALRLIFDPFVVRNDSPLEYGIHLMACYFIVHHHGGKIEARSENGRGTTFTIRLPADPNLAPAVESDTDFLRKVLLSDALWEKLISSE